MQKVIVSVTNNLTTDQRVHKICSSLIKMGFEVLLVGRLLSGNIPLERNYNTHRIKLYFNKGFLFYAEYNFRLFWYLLFQKKDILLANDLDTLLPNYLASKIGSKKLVYDSHELFTEIPELVKRPSVQKVWLFLEQLILPKIKNTYTVCQSIADYYNALYQTNFKIIRNTPVYNYVNKKLERKNIKTIIYQGAINIGRGLELMIETMQYLSNYEFIIIGDGDILNELKKLVSQYNLNKKVSFLGKIKPEELKKITRCAHIGISMEEDLGLNYRYALPNKIFDYIHADIPVLVSDLPEMKQLVLDYEVGEIIRDRNPKQLALQITSLISRTETFSDHLKKAALELQWKNEEETLMEVFSDLK